MSSRASHRLGFFSGSFAEGRRWQLTPAIGPDRWEGEGSDQEATFWRGTRPTPPREDGAMKCSSWALASAGLGRSSQGGSNPKGEKLATSVTNRPQHDGLGTGWWGPPRPSHRAPHSCARRPPPVQTGGFGAQRGGLPGLASPPRGGSWLSAGSSAASAPLALVSKEGRSPREGEACPAVAQQPPPKPALCSTSCICEKGDLPASSC